MSHFTKTETQIKNIEALKRACQKMNLEVAEGGSARGWQGSTLKADYVIKLQGPFDVAVIQQNDGTYSLTADWHGGHVARQIGQNANTLKQNYGAEVVRMEAESRGMHVETEKLADGTIRYRLREMQYGRRA